MKTFAEAEEVLAAALPGYESRLAQQNLAAAIETIMSMPENFTTYDGDPDEFVDWVRPGIMHLLGQAACVTGKSLAYLIPSILSAKRIVVSVTTNPLQVVILLPIPVFLQIALLLHIGSGGLALLLQFVEGVSADAFNVIVLVVEICMGSARSD